MTKSRRCGWPVAGLSVALALLCAVAALAGPTPPDRPWRITRKPDLSKLQRGCRAGDPRDCGKLDEFVSRGPSWLLESLTDQALLARFAWENAEPSVRELALRRLTDPAVLEAIALENSDPRLRELALRRLTDPAVLEAIALENSDPRLREIALDRLADQPANQPILARIAMEQVSYSDRAAALERLTDQLLLEGIAREHGDASIRGLALRRLTDPGVVSQLVFGEADRKACETGLDRLTELYRFRSLPPPPQWPDLVRARLSYKWCGEGLWVEARAESVESWVESVIDGDSLPRWLPSDHRARSEVERLLRLVDAGESADGELKIVASGNPVSALYSRAPFSSPSTHYSGADAQVVALLHLAGQPVVASTHSASHPPPASVSERLYLEPRDAPVGDALHEALSDVLFFLMEEMRKARDASPGPGG